MPNYELYYEQLKVEHGADEETIKRAYKKLALKFHPDKNQGDAEATKKFLEIGTAYEVSRGTLLSKSIYITPSWLHVGKFSYQNLITT